MNRKDIRNGLLYYSGLQQQQQLPLSIQSLLHSKLDEGVMRILSIYLSISLTHTPQPLLICKMPIALKLCYGLFFFCLSSLSWFFFSFSSSYIYTRRQQPHEPQLSALFFLESSLRNDLVWYIWEREAERERERERERKLSFSLIGVKKVCRNVQKKKSFCFLNLLPLRSSLSFSFSLYFLYFSLISLCFCFCFFSFLSLVSSLQK